MKLIQTILVLTAMACGGGIAHGQNLVPQLEKDTAIKMCTLNNPKELCICLFDAVELIAKSLGAEYKDGLFLFPNDMIVIEAQRRYLVMSEGCYVSHATKVK